MFQRVCIVGLGFMGASLGLDVRNRQVASEAVGFDVSAEACEVAVRVGAIDRFEPNLSSALRSADLVVLAAPPDAVLRLLPEIAALADPGALVTDIAGVKGRIVALGERRLGDRFIGGHPMCGSPSGGAAAARPGLFEGSAWILARETEFDLEQDDAARELGAFAASLGARPVTMSAGQHDDFVALVSHLPHLLAFAYSDTVASLDVAADAAAIGGASYRDMTRVAAANRKLWSGIFAENRDALERSLRLFTEQLHALASDDMQREGAECAAAGDG